MHEDANADETWVWQSCSELGQQQQGGSIWRVELRVMVEDQQLCEPHFVFEGLLVSEVQPSFVAVAVVGERVCSY